MDNCNFRITTAGAEALALGGYVTLADAALLAGVSRQRIQQIAGKLQAVRADKGAVYVSVAAVALRWPEATADWEWATLNRQPMETPDV